MNGGIRYKRRFKRLSLFSDKYEFGEIVDVQVMTKRVK